MTKTKKCFKCGKRKRRHLFYAHPMMADGLLGKCKACAKRDARDTRRRRPEHYKELERKRRQSPERRESLNRLRQERRKRHPGKFRCYTIVARAIRDGRLARQPCETCGAKKVQAHHEDYRRPLHVRWLCFKCHRTEHGQVVVSGWR